MRSNPWETADLVEFTEEILNRKLQFLYSVCNLLHGSTVNPVEISLK